MTFRAYLKINGCLVASIEKPRASYRGCKSLIRVIQSSIFSTHRLEPPYFLAKSNCLLIFIKVVMNALIKTFDEP